MNQHETLDISENHCGTRNLLKNYVQCINEDNIQWQNNFI